MAVVGESTCEIASRPARIASAALAIARCVVDHPAVATDERTTGGWKQFETSVKGHFPWLERPEAFDAAMARAMAS